MAPNLSPSVKQLICDMTSSGMSIAKTAKAAHCSKQTVKYIRSNLRQFGSVKAPPNRVGRRQMLTPSMLKVLCDHLLEKPGLYLDEMVVFLWDEFNVLVTTSSISRALKKKGWSKKTTQKRAREQTLDLRDEYRYGISEFQSYHLVFVDESGCDKRIGFRRTGWSPLGIASVQISKFHRDQRYQILPAYSQDGIVLSRVFQGSTDAAVFEDFIAQLLQHCGTYPEPKSVLVMDNASFHRTELMEKMCAEKGVKLVYLPPYSPDLNPIEEFFAELKAFIKRHWEEYERNPSQCFNTFLSRCIDVAGAREKHAKGHFLHAGLTINEK